MDDFAEGYDTAARDDREEFKRLDKRIAELEAVLRELVHAALHKGAVRRKAVAAHSSGRTVVTTGLSRPAAGRRPRS